MPVFSAIRLWLSADDYLSFDYAVAAARYEPQGERIKDRHGNVHRISPGVPRYPSWLELSIPASELTLLSNAGAAEPRSALQWLDEAFRRQLALTVFVHGETLADDGSAILRRLAYRGRVDELSGCGLTSLPGHCGPAGRQPASVATDPDWLELRLHISEDGSFSDHNDIESYVSFDPAR